MDAAAEPTRTRTRTLTLSRWMQRQNKNITDRIKRDEYKRVQAFVQLAYENDPRVIAHRESVAAAKLAAKAAKEEALAQERAARP